jgi:lysylphosphatidylglycerol synthetase-like protein (DUF2156 family)
MRVHVGFYNYSVTVKNLKKDGGNFIMDGLFGIVWLIWIIALLVFYHKVFTVYYFSLSNGILRELIAAAFFGGIMTVLTFYLWWLTAIIIIIAGLVNMSKSGNKSHIVVAIVLAIVVAVIGISMRGNSNSSDASSSAFTPTIITEYDIQC